MNMGRGGPMGGPPPPHFMQGGPPPSQFSRPPPGAGGRSNYSAPPPGSAPPAATAAAPLSSAVVSVTTKGGKRVEFLFKADESMEERRASLSKYRFDEQSLAAKASSMANSIEERLKQLQGSAARIS